MSIPAIKDFSNYDQYSGEANATTDAEMQEYMGNQNSILEAMVDVGLWQPETNYPNGHVVFSPNMPNGTEAVCVATNGGKSSDTEPSWGEVGGDNVSDGTCFWKLRWKHWSKVVIPMENLGIEYATQAEAEAGSDNEKLMTPLLTKNAIDKFAPVKSVNGKTGDVVVGEIVDASINGKVITLTFADGTTKTLTTQDTNTTTIYTPDYSAGVSISNNVNFTAPSNGFIVVGGYGNAGGNDSAKSYFYVNGVTVGTMGSNAGYYSHNVTSFWVKKGDIFKVNYSKTLVQGTFFPLKAV